MSAFVVVILVVVGVLVGLALGYLLGKSSNASALSQAKSDAATAKATLDAERNLAAQRSTDEQANLERLKTQFEALAADALKANTESFLTVAEERLKRTEQTNNSELEKQQKAVENLMTPIKASLEQVDKQLRDLEVERGKAYAELREQVGAVQTNNESLKKETASLVQALRAPQARGRWGEMQLRRIVELSGMTDRCDFYEQESVINADGQGQRPDMVVRIAGDRNVVVDSKVTLAAFLDAYESVDPAFIEDRLQAHARHLREHVKNLSATAYWKQFTPAPEFVVLFVPGESFLAPALERDRDLLEFAMSKNVIIATPTTLISMLKTIAYAWQQEKLSQNAQQVLDLGKELYDRLGKLGGHISTLGKSIESVTKNFNNTVSSLESRVLVSARKLNDLEIVGESLEQPKMVESSVNQLSKAELVEGAQEELSIRLVDEVPAIEPPASSTGA